MHSATVGDSNDLNFIY